MTVKDYKQFLELSKVFNKTFGAPGAIKSSTETVIVKLVDDTMLSAMFIIVVNFSSEGMWRELRKRYLEEGLDRIQDVLKNAKEEIKENTGETVSFKIMQDTISDGLEFVSYSMYNPKKTAYFRVYCNIEVSAGNEKE